MPGRYRSSGQSNHNTNSQQQSRNRHYNNNIHQHVTQLSDHCYRPNRSVYHGHPSDSYSTNYRHPSTTTTTTTTTEASQARSQTLSSSDNNCSKSICYAYMIAIISSFLVVLGFYLSITKFNALYLYISLIGFSIVAVSACIYCISNIRSSRLSRRKQRINSDDFILGTNGIAISTDLTNFNLDNNNTRGPELTTVTHILTNRTLIANNSTNSSDDNGIQNNSSAIINIDNNGNNTQVDNNTQLPLNELTNEPQSMTDNNNLQNFNSNEPMNNIDLSPNDNNNNQQVSINISNRDDQIDSTTTSLSILDSSSSPSSNLLPNTEVSSCPKAENQTDNNDIKNCHIMNNQPELQIIQNQNDQVILTTQPTTSKTQNNNNSIKIINQNDPPNKLERSIMFLANQNQIIEQSTASNSSQHNNDNGEIISPNETNSDLINLQQEGEATSSKATTSSVALESNQVIKKKSKNQHAPRPANLRRTLVMGLSGEEEMIEIDEEDLDNMSIVPPSYESILAIKQNNTTNNSD